MYLCFEAVTSPLAANAEAADTNSITSDETKGLFVKGQVIDGSANSLYAASAINVPVVFIKNVF